jgi:hypothetical protein
VRADFEAAFDIEAFGVYGAALELGDASARVADEMMVMGFGEFVARTVAEVEPSDGSDLGEKVEGAIHGDEADVRAFRVDLIEALVLFGGEGFEDRNPLRSGFVTPPLHLPYDRGYSQCRPSRMKNLCKRLNGS